MPEIPFVGPSYLDSSPNVDCERSINLYAEKVESENGKAKVVLKSTPGKTVFCTLPTTKCRGSYVVRGTIDRLLAVMSGVLYEVFSDGTYTARGTLRTTTGYVSFSNNPTQVCIVDGPNGYIFTLSDNSFSTIISDGFLGGTQVLYIDGYFVADQPDSNIFALSQLNDGTIWDGLDHATKEGNPDNIKGIVNLHRELLLMGQIGSEVWYDSGANTFPFAPIPGVFIEKGVYAPFSLKKLDNTIFWVGGDDNGQLVVYRLAGYLSQRVSTHSIEYLLRTKFGDPSGIVAYTYQENGHDFYVLNSPTSDTTIVFDVATGWWHERMSFNELGMLDRDRANFCNFAFGKQIMFDYLNGKVYLSSLEVYTCDTAKHPRIRVTPHSRSDLKYVFYGSLQIDMQTGVGNSDCPNPVATLKCSNDGGRSYGSERTVSIGAVGKTRARARFTRLGRSRDRVHWFEISDPVPVTLIAASADYTVGAV